MQGVHFVTDSNNKKIAVQINVEVLENNLTKLEKFLNTVISAPQNKKRNTTTTGVTNKKLIAINKVIKAYFKNNKVNKIAAKELMPEFIKAGIFSKDHKEGLPIRRILRTLDKTDQLNLIPYVLTERKERNTNWFFKRV